MRTPFLRALIAALIFSVVAGCGGGGSTQSESGGKIAVAIAWPDRSRLIPVASNAIKVTISKGETVLATRVLARPQTGNQTNTTFENLKIGDLTFAALAYPNADGTGVAQATGTSIVTTQSGQTANVSLTMNSTIDHMELGPA